MPKISAENLLKQNTTRPEWFIPGWLIARQINLLAGEVAAGKSFAALDLALGAAIRGEAWGGLPVRRANVLYLSLDTPLATMAVRLASLAGGAGLREIPNLTFDDDFYDLSINEGTRALMRYMKTENTGLLIVDALSRYLLTGSENSVSRTNQAFAMMGMLTRLLNCTVVVIHHLNKRGGPGLEGEGAARRIRGSSNIFASVDSGLLLTSEGGVRTLRSVKNRLAEPPPPLHFAIRGEPDALRLDFSVQPPTGAVTGVREALSDHLLALLRAHPGQPFTRSALLAALEQEGLRPSIGTMQRALDGLEQFGVGRRWEKHRKVYHWGEDSNIPGF